MGKKNQFTRELEQSYYKMAKAKGKSLIEIAMDKAYRGNDTILMALLKKIVADKKDIAHEGIDQNLTFNSIAYHWSKARTGVQKEAEPVDDRNSNRIRDTRDNK